MYTELLEGAYDLHVHLGPDVSERKLDDLEMAERIQKIGMKGFGIKSHYFCTAARAKLVKKIYPNLNPVGAITLNQLVGGVSPLAVEMAARDGAKLVWMPTFDAKNEQEFFLKKDKYDKLPYWAQLQFELKEQGITQPHSSISILDENGKLKKESLDVLDLISKHQLILATGHLSKREIFALVTAARDKNVKKIIITHPTFSSVGLSKEEQKELAELGAYLEHCFALVKPRFGIDWDELYEQIRYVGPDHCILSTDTGQPYNPYPDEGLQTFVSNLLNNGFTKEQIKRMSVENTTLLVEG
ncbi:DUF6282 family protein [Metabacillus arenae]|uniref:Cytosolic protein n=1 Tax=Metabacillus arenae TaxID=2771434 RepID=A0A926NIH1_9BACI|nr:DUF6282 family protein [Metabacillus arenae]MBD1382314.1 cytosolic protein [Metabacillus arenae]